MVSSTKCLDVIAMRCNF